MTVLMPASVSKTTLNRINECIPNSKRSKLISEFILSENFKVPNSVDEIINMAKTLNEEEKTNLPIFFSEQAANKIDSLLRHMQGLLDSHNISIDITRSTVIRTVLEQFSRHVQAEPIHEVVKEKILINMPAGTKQKLNQYIDKMERSSTIESFLLDGYKVTNDIDILKARLVGEKEVVSLYISEESLKCIDSLVRKLESKKVKRTHILRDVINQLIIELESTGSLEQDELESTIKDLMNKLELNRLKKLIKSYSHLIGE